MQSLFVHMKVHDFLIIPSPYPMDKDSVTAFSSLECEHTVAVSGSAHGTNSHCRAKVRLLCVFDYLRGFVL